MLIKTTGLEEYAPGGEARVKVMTIGGPGVGKTRWASYFPKPIYADCERGLASVADRQVPYVTVLTSQDMLDLLNFLKTECRQPWDQRKYQTVVIDTLDAFQRKVKQEWCDQNRKEAFSGWEAWGYLNAKMQMLLTRLLNLDLNVIVNVHFKDKTTTDTETGRETHELMLQLQGETADTAFNDFDLVGWMGTYFEAENGERVQKRGLTFTPVPDKPFLKDRLHITPKWLPVTFDDTDYELLFERLAAKASEMKAGETVGEIPSGTPAVAPSPAVVAPGQAGTGALPDSAPKDIPLAQLDRPTLIKRARDLGVETTVDGTPIRGNTLKAELIAALEAHARAPKPAPAPEGAAPAPAAADPPATTQQPAPSVAESAKADPGKREAAKRPAKTAAAKPAPTVATVATDDGQVDTTTGEILTDPVSTPASTPPDAMTQAATTVQEQLGGEVIDESPAPTPEPPAPTPQPPAVQDKPDGPKPEEVCEVCGKDLRTEDQNFVRVAYIKFRARLCREHYDARKAGR